MEDKSIYDPEMKGSPYTAGQLFGFMFQGAIYGIVIFGVAVIFVLALYLFGEWFLPRDVEAFLDTPIQDAIAQALQA